MQAAQPNLDADGGDGDEVEDWVAGHARLRRGVKIFYSKTNQYGWLLLTSNLINHV
jgi:hypothetical protein